VRVQGQVISVGGRLLLADEVGPHGRLRCKLSSPFPQAPHATYLQIASHRQAQMWGKPDASIFASLGI